MEKLNSGGIKMKVTFTSTKVGNGFKIAVDDKWLYVNKKSLLGVVSGESKSCQFKTIEDEE